MALRTNEGEVRRIISTVLSSEAIGQFLEDASLWVTEELVGKGLSDDRLAVIERYLTCALIRVRELGLKMTKLDDVSESYQVDPSVSEYLLRAADFDSTGTVRKAFLAPKDVRVAGWRVGQSFTDEVRTETPLL